MSLAAGQARSPKTPVHLCVVMVQQDFLVGDIPGNAQKIIAAAKQAATEHAADIVVFPELTLTGYPPEDLLLRPSLDVRVQAAIAEICAAELQPAVVFGAPLRNNGSLYNAALVIDGGEVCGRYFKQFPPNYQVFDEKRYFASGRETLVVRIRDVAVGITICEDLWANGPAENAAAAGAKLLLNLNASPYSQGKQPRRKSLVQRKAQASGVPIVYVNLVGAQDELVFDGGSLVADGNGEIAAEAAQFIDGLFAVSFQCGEVCQPVAQPLPQPLSANAAVYQALVMGLRDYVGKNGFKSVVLGLSGGIDSALTLAIAVDAVGRERVRAVMMPFRYTADISLQDAEAQAHTMGVHYDVFSIEPMYDSFMATLAEPFAGTSVDTTEQNLQARLA